MGKPRIVIADEDEDYIVPLQKKFIDTFFDRIDLEIITEKNSLGLLFSTPQKIDIMVVSEKLYSIELQKHDIKNVFLMVEQLSDVQIDDATVKRIFKYTKNIKVVFNEIIGSSLETLKIDKEIKKQTQTIIVSSASGGAGKTTIALGIAVCLVQAHKSVIYIDAEFIQSFQFFLNNATSMSNEIIPKFQIGNETLFKDIQKHIQKELFEYLPPFPAAISAYNINFEVFSNLINQIKTANIYDFIIVDTDSTFNDDKGDLIDNADKVFIVIRQNRYSVYKTNCMLKNINYSDTDKFLFLCNAFKPERENALLNTENYPLFIINEYINWINECENMKLEKLANIDSLQKIAYSLL